MVIKNSSLSLWGDIRDISHTSQAKNGINLNYPAARYPVSIRSSSNHRLMTCNCSRSLWIVLPLTTTPLESVDHSLNCPILSRVQTYRTDTTNRQRAQNTNIP